MRAYAARGINVKRPLFERLTSFRGDANFAMPGHKNRVTFDFDWREDLTEIVGADNLLNPEDCIKASQEEMAKAYGVAQTVMVPAGSTTAIKIALFLATNPGDCVLVQRNSHLSLFHGAVSLDLKLSYLDGEVDEATGLFAGITPESVEEALDKNPHVTAVFLTSPDYFGGILPLKAIADIVGKRGKKLIVDEAHGAHLPFSELRAFSAVHYADYTVQSLHKTAPALTGAALLHLKEEENNRRLLKGMQHFLSTSPSYLTMLSSEFAVAAMEEGYDDERVNRWREEIIQNVSDLYVPDRRGEGLIAHDPGKLLFHMAGRRGDEVVESLAKRGVHLEMSDRYYALAILSPYNTDEDFRKLMGKLKDLPTGKAESFHMTKMPKGEVVLSPREAFFSPTRSVSVKESVGCIAADTITPYPPGIPIITYGERITCDIADYIADHPDAIGISDGMITVVKEEL